ncbi:MAG TPA: hypothetical protein VMH28_31850 [Candidatus Acidoferrales bacterium]|nr:hypothetical protein [Candidatus Acidoferrales bacterium]
MRLTRRNLVQLAAIGLAPWRLIRAASDFWNTRDPDSWTPDEIARLLKKSPWAKEISGTRATTSKKGITKTVTEYRGTIVWESAKVIRDAARSPLPNGFEGEYVLSIAGIPLSKSSSRNALDNLRQVSMLHVKGKDPLEAAAVVQNKNNGAIYYFGFSREVLPLTKDDKDLTFTTRVGKVVLSAKFNPKDMLYRGELSV